MGYSGKQVSRSGDIRRFNFTGNGSNTAFDLGFTPATQNQLIVTVNGLVQHYDAFSISGSTLTFDGTPASGDAIQVTAVVDAVGVAAIPDGAIANVSTLTVSGNSTFTGSITGTATFANAVTVAGIITATANVNIDAGTLFVDGTNNRVGINNTAPTSALTVTGSAAFSSTVAMGSDYLSPHSVRNKFINGDMRVWQRGTSFSSIGTSTYAADRWFSNYGGTAPTFSRSTDVPTGFQYSFSLAGSSTSYHGIGQRIESLNTADLSGQTVTLSFYAKLSSGTATGGLNISAGYANSVDNFGATTEFDGTNITSTIAGSWTRYTKTFTVPATAATNGFHVIIFCPGATQTFTLLLTGLQLERGSVATPFEFRPYGLEFGLCQRYFFKTNPGFVTGSGGLSGAYFGTTNGSVGYQFPITMRAAPTVTRSTNNNTFYVSNIDGATPGTDGSVSISTTGMWQQLSSMTSAAIGYPIFYNGSLSISAEL